MNNLRDRIELVFESLVHTIFQYKWIVLFVTLISTFLLIMQIRHLKIDTSTEALFYKDDPEIVQYDRFREQFGSAEVAIVAIQTPDVFSVDFLKKLKSFHEDLENNVPYLDDITSLVNVTATRGEEDELIIEELMEKWPDHQQDLDRYINFLREYVTTNPLYRDYIISDDNTFTAIIMKPNAFSTEMPAGMESDSDDFLNDSEQTYTKKSGNTDRGKLSDKENEAFVDSLIAISQKYRSKDFSIFIAGQPVLSYSIETKMQKDVPRFTGLAIAIIFILLFILFRRPSGILLPLIIVILSMLSTLALFGIFHSPFTIISQIIPSFIISVGVCDSVHLLAVFYRRFTIHVTKEDAMAYAMGHSGLAVLMTSLTTAGGLLSFSGAKIAPIAHMGVYAAAGVILALLYSIILLPALIAIIPIQPKQQKTGSFERFFDTILLGLGEFGTRKPLTVIGISTVIVIVSAIGISRLHFSHDPVAWFPEDDLFPSSTLMIDKNMKGSMTMEAIVETNRENALYDPDLMNRLETFNRAAEKLTEEGLFVGKSISVADTLKQINKSLNENRTTDYKIPQNKKLIAQEFVLFENGGTDDLENLVDSRFSQARITIKLPWRDANTYTGIQKKLTALLTNTLGDAGAVTITGMSSLLTRTIYNVIVTMMSSYIIALVVITLMMIFLVGSLKYGFLSMIPNLMPILISLGLMGFARINLDLSNILIGSIIIGLAVDDTVHFFHNFRRYYNQTNNVHTAVQETLVTAGRAMLFTSLVLISGFIVFIVSDMKNLVNFGLITGLAIFTALLADLVLAPALMAVFTPAPDAVATEVEIPQGFHTI